MDHQQRHIGMWDSGIGGLTVMREVKKSLPCEKIIYFGDTARVPYGGRSPDTIIRYSIENSVFLMQQDLKVLIIACNTACSYAQEKIQKIFNIPIVGVIQPAAEKAVQVTRRGRIAVLGTRATIASNSYQKAIRELLPEAVLFPIACPLFVPLVEEKFLSHAAARLIVKEYLSGLKQQDVDTVVLGCTHYPMLHDLIQNELGDEMQIIDSAKTCAETVSQLLENSNLRHPRKEHQLDAFFCSDDPMKFREAAQELLGRPIEHVEAIIPDSHHLHEKKGLGFI